jgi:hypothetical protein
MAENEKGLESGYKYVLNDPIDMDDVEYDAMVLLVKEKDKAKFDNVRNAPCVTVKLQFNGINEKLNLPVFTVIACEKNEELGRLLDKPLEGDCFDNSQGDCFS